MTAIAHQQCPACGHHTSACLGGRCTAFVPGPPGGPHAAYCDCPCYREITGRDFDGGLAEVFRKFYDKETRP